MAKPIILIVGLWFIQLFLNTTVNHSQTGVYFMILGNVQDAGSPQIGCEKNCCKNLIQKPDPNRKVSSLGLIDYTNKKTWLIDATPDIVTQNTKLQQKAGFGSDRKPDGIFLTHAHIGHYSGLMYLGREAWNTQNLLVYAMPKMTSFLESNGPWSLLVKLKNIELKKIQDGQNVELNKQLKITPLLVPHRDEFSETVGFLIEGPKKSMLYIPDIDKWEKWNQSIEKWINSVDIALIDATFFDGKELKNREMKEVPHPCAVETMELLKGMSIEHRNKVWFTHLNHTNPLLNPKSKEHKMVEEAGMHVAYMGLFMEL
jgi:pyrroloquinoline quinone biosynthesis protein B